MKRIQFARPCVDPTGALLLEAFIPIALLVAGLSLNLLWGTSQGADWLSRPQSDVAELRSAASSPGLPPSANGSWACHRSVLT
jgi:hypothetical protein